MSNRRAQDERIEGTPDGVNAITEIVDVPDVPTIGTAIANVSGASVTFTPATTGGTPSLYTATSTPGSITGTSATSPITVSGLTVGTAYTFTVTPSNSTGTGPASSSSNSITPIDLINGYDALATITVPSGGLASVTFAGVPTGYSHLQLRYIVRGNRADETDDFRMRFNGDVGTNYSWHTVGGVSTNPNPYWYGSANANGIAHYEGIPATNSTANVFCATVCDILDYASTKNKTVRFIQGFNTNGDVKSLVAFNSGSWRNTGVISSITLSPIYGSGIVQNSQFELYGVK